MRYREGAFKLRCQLVKSNYKDGSEKIYMDVQIITLCHSAAALYY